MNDTKIKIRVPKPSPTRLILYTFNEEELEFFEDRLSPVEVWMARRRCLGFTAQKIAEEMNCSQPNVCGRLKQLHRKIEVLRELPQIRLTSMHDVIRCHFATEKDYQLVVLFVRNFSLKEIAIRLYGMDAYKVVTEKLMQIIEELASCKDAHIPSHQGPHFYSEAFKALYARRVEIVRPPEQMVYRINGKIPNDTPKTKERTKVLTGNPSGRDNPGNGKGHLDSESKS
jgi:aromatic ring-opening dioxygenase LigB subunit